MNTQDKEEMIFELLDDFTSNGKLYYDDEEESIWMINPETKEWIFEFKKSGKLWYLYPVFKNIFKWISMEHPDFNPYIAKWVERILQTEVKNTQEGIFEKHILVERILQTEVKNTYWFPQILRQNVERILQTEVKNTILCTSLPRTLVERILQTEVKNTWRSAISDCPEVERILNKYDVISETNINSD